MKISDAKKLHKGDQVYWNDPAPGGCSRVFNINSISVYPGGVVYISDDLGDVECYARELSHAPSLNYCQHKGCEASIEGWATHCEKHSDDRGRCPNCHSHNLATITANSSECHDCGHFFTEEPEDLWNNNEVQFARLLCEVVAVADPSPSILINSLADSMDLSTGEVNKLLDRAHAVWEASKKAIVPKAKTKTKTKTKTKKRR